MKAVAVFLGRRPRWRLLRWCVISLGVVALSAAAPGAETSSSAEILQDLRQFREMGTVLYVAAHPDDENTQLITYLARGRGYRTAYLSVTRGDGGQNVLGGEFGDELGVIRTQELLAARRLDGGRQFFTRAIDFGFSKDAGETLRIWDRQQVLADIVRVIRTFQPDVIITRFSPHPGGTHGHHTSSAILALEAFKVAGDPKAFPEQLDHLTPWQPKRIMLNGFSRGGEPGTNAGVIRLDINGDDPVLGESFSEIAARSRAMHKTQGFDNFRGFGGRGGGARMESFQLLAGEPASKDIMDGVDTTWKRVAGGEAVGQMAQSVIEQFQTNNPAASLPALLKLRAGLETLPHSPLLDDKRRQLARIVQHCLGLTVRTTVPQAEVVPGETIGLRHTVMLGAEFPVRWVGIRYPAIGKELKPNVLLHSGQAVTHETTQTLPTDAPLSQPYWLREDHPIGMFRVQDPALLGRPENPPAFPIEQVFELGNQTLVIDDEPVQAGPDLTKAENRKRLEIIAPVSLSFAADVALFAPSSTHAVEVKVTAARPNTKGTVHLDVPQGWRVTPEHDSFQLAAAGQAARFNFSVTAPEQSTTAALTAHALVGGREFDNQHIEIAYRHIPAQLLQPPAREKALSLQLAIRGHEIGYIAGAGDSVAHSLQDMGYAVRQLTGADLTSEKLHDLDAVVIGVRAFNVRTDLAPHMSTLFEYIQAGGTVIAQYNRPNDLKVEQLAPFELHISNERVTDEDAPVTLLEPDHPALATPNKITQADFQGWVQERGLYFPDHWAEQFKPLLACSDPGESPLKGGLLVARYGQGYFVYTGLAWFRQLPAGVPGAYRLFANLVSLGKTGMAGGAGGAR